MYRMACLVITAAGLVACADPNAPESPPLRPSETSSHLSEYPLESEVSHLRGQVGGEVGVRVWWEGSRAHVSSDLSFFGNFAELTTQLIIFKGAQELPHPSPFQVRTAKGLFPIWSKLTDHFSRDVGQSCGHFAEATASAVMEVRAIPVSGGQTIIIAGVRDDDRADARQPDCVPPPGSGGPYDEQCEFCLEWTWYWGNTEVDKTYQCSPAMSCPAQ